MMCQWTSSTKSLFLGRRQNFYFCLHKTDALEIRPNWRATTRCWSWGLFATFASLKENASQCKGTDDKLVLDSRMISHHLVSKLRWETLSTSQTLPWNSGQMQSPSWLYSRRSWRNVPLHNSSSQPICIHCRALVSLQFWILAKQRIFSHPMRYNCTGCSNHQKMQNSRRRQDVHELWCIRCNDEHEKAIKICISIKKPTVIPRKKPFSFALNKALALLLGQSASSLSISILFAFRRRERSSSVHTSIVKILVFPIQEVRAFHSFGM